MGEVSDDEKKAIILDSIRGVPDFPKKGILFWDVTTILLNHTAFKYTIDLFVKKYKDAKIDVVAGDCGARFFRRRPHQYRSRSFGK